MSKYNSSDLVWFVSMAVGIVGIIHFVHYAHPNEPKVEINQCQEITN